MTDPKNDAAALTDEAVAWLIRLRDPACTRQDRKQFEAWLSADEAHAREYHSLLAIWTASGDVPPSFPPPQSGRISIRNIRFSRLISLALLLLSVLLLAWYTGWLPSSYDTYTNEKRTRQVILPDGSEAQLGTNTSFAFLRFRGHGEIRFSRGEALFGVNDDTTAALEVVVGGNRVTAPGAEFNIWYDGDRAVVTPVSGSLRIQGPRANRVTLLLSVGEQARFSKAAPVPQVNRADLERTLAWRQGKLILSDTSLADALPLINRYLNEPLRLGDEASARVRIGGIFSIGDMEALVRALPRMAPVRVVPDDDGNRVIYSAPRRPP